MMNRVIAVSAEEYTERRLNLSWKDAVFPELSESRRLALEDCGKIYAIGKCDRCGAEGAVRIGCKDRLCYPCDLARRRLQVADKMEILDRLYAELHEPVACSGFTFTSPSDTWKLVRDFCRKWNRSLWDELKVIEGMVKDTLVEHYGGESLPSEGHQKRLRRYVIGGDLAAQPFHSFHQWKKGNVWRGFMPHVHASVYSVMFDRAYVLHGLEGDKVGAFVKRRLGLSNSEVQALRLKLASEYKRRFEARYGKSKFQAVGKGPKGQDSSWIVNYRYYPRRHDVEHWTSYMFRSEVQECYREVVWNRDAPSTEGERGWFRELVSIRDRGSHGHVAFGWMSSPVLNKYARRLGVAFEPKAKRDANRRLIPCSKCGDGIIRFSWYERRVTLSELGEAGIPILRRDFGASGWNG
jgi:hypothetical protein